MKNIKLNWKNLLEKTIVKYGLYPRFTWDKNKLQIETYDDAKKDKLAIANDLKSINKELPSEIAHKYAEWLYWDEKTMPKDIPVDNTLGVAWAGDVDLSEASEKVLELEKHRAATGKEPRTSVVLKELALTEYYKNGGTATLFGHKLLDDQLMKRYLVELEEMETLMTEHKEQEREHDAAKY